jgi:replicative DNA helicase
VELALSEPFLLMIAGPNGAGKTTLTQHLLRKDVDLGEYINPDDIAAGLTGTLAERTKQAQLIADKRRNECISAKRSFSFETVMSHPSKIEILVRAKEAGYTVLLYFVGTDDPQTNIERVALRVAQGGHAVPDDKVRDRWLRTMTLLQQAIRSSDRSYIFDNSVVGTVDTVPRLVFHRSATRSGRLPQYELIGAPPAWITRFVLNPIGVNFFDNYANSRQRTAVGSIVTLPVEAGVQTQSDTIATLTEAAPRSLPHSIETEQRLLGTIIANSEAFHRVSDFLEPKHMFEPIHQTIYEAAGTLIRVGKIAAADSLRTLLPIDVDLGGLMTLGQYLDRLVAEATTLAKAHEDGRIIYELSLRRELIRLGENIVSAAYDNQADSSPRLQIKNARSQLHELETGRRNRLEPTLPFQPPLTHGLHQFSKALVNAVDSAARAYVRIGSGMSTGFRDVDRQIAGLQPSELIVLASRPGIGKTALATNVAYNVAKSWGKETRDLGGESAVSGGVVGFFSLEMSSEQIATRVISQQSGIPISVIRRGAITERDFEIIRDQSIEFQKLPLFIDETTALSIEQLASRAHRLIREKGLDLLIIDNLELLRIAARTDFGETRSGSLQITRELKKLAKDLDIPVLVLAQLPSKIDKRQDKRPKLEDFSDKGAIEQDADVIIFLHRDDFYLLKDEPSPGSYEHSDWMRQVELAYGRAELIIAKQRNGATGTVQLSFNSSIGAFGDLQV